jgi:hypothetical protein
MGSKECQGSKLYVVKNQIMVNIWWFLHCLRRKSTLSVLSGRIEKERAYPKDNDDHAFKSYTSFFYDVTYLLGLLEQEAPF